MIHGVTYSIPQAYLTIQETKNTTSADHSSAGKAQSQTKNTNEIRVSFRCSSWLLIRTRKPDRFRNHRPNHTVTVVTLSIKLEPRSSLLDFDLISDTGISAGRRRPVSANETVLTRTCVDGVGCTIDDGGPLRIGPDIFETPRPTRMRMSVGAMPCVELGDNRLTTNSRPFIGEKYARRLAQQSLQRRPARGARWRRGRRK